MADPINDEIRRAGFESLVLQSLWLIIRLMLYSRKQGGGMGGGYDLRATDLRANLIGYFDTYARQDEGAKNYRRSHTFPEMGNEP